MRAALALVLVFVPLVVAACGGADEQADVVFRHGRIYTLGGPLPASPLEEPVVEALAIRAGKIVAAGTDAEIGRFVGSGTAVHDLGGATVVPGFVDCHLHLSSLGRSLVEVDLVGTRSYDEVVSRAAERAESTPKGRWITGRGWDQNDWPVQGFPDHAALSAATPEHPVLLRRIDGHAALANARALEAAGIDRATADPPGGRLERRPDGTPTGVLVDAAVELVRRHVPPPTADEKRAVFAAALAHCAALGLTGVHDAGASPSEVAVLRSMLAAGLLPLRVYEMWDATPEHEEARELAAALEAGPQPFDPTMHLAVRCVKLMADGALGSRGAALLEPYSDAPGQRGLPQYASESLLAIVRPLHASGWQIATHAIGDAANRMVLDAYESAARARPRPDARHRIEHAQILSPADIPRFAALGVLASVQPTHCTSDMPWAPARLGPERLAGAYAWRSLRAAGAAIACGSDAPVESASPLLGLYAAVTRRGTDGAPPGGWAPEERLTISEALRGFTLWAAVSSFTERELGSLEPGKQADLTVLDRDIVGAEPAQLLEARVLQTVVSGEIVHAAPSPPGSSRN
jgi:hypothetical protein